MKEWQHGYELDYLLRVEALFSQYNAAIRSPFQQMKKNRVAEALSKGQLRFDEENKCAVQFRVAKSASAIRRYSAYRQPVTAHVKQGDLVIDRIAYDEDSSDSTMAVMQMIASYHFDNRYLIVRDASMTDRKVAFSCGFERVGCKINTHADVLGVYYRGEDFNDSTTLFEEEHDRFPALLDGESIDCSICTLPVRLEALVHAIRQKLASMNLTFANHYSNYNGDNSWSALSLRGYSDDIAFIEKPAEMSKKWKAEHPDASSILRDTMLFRDFEEVRFLLNMTFGGDARVHRVRFMKLAKGTLSRHTDQVDPDAGVENGKLMRFHFPIVTNTSVKFRTWSDFDSVSTIHMPAGQAFYLDVRKPHEATNGGDVARVHLVVDVEASDAVRALVPTRIVL